MRTPPRARRLVLLALAGAAVGGVHAVHGRKRKPASPGPAAPHTSAPAGPPPVVPPAGPSDPSRSPAGMAVIAVIVVVLALVAVVVARPADTGRSGSPRTVLTRSPGPFGMYTEVTAPVPVGRTETVTLTGDDGFRAEARINPAADPCAPVSPFPGQRIVVVTIHLGNTGKAPFGTRLDPDAWVLDAAGRTHAADQMTSVMTGPPGSTDPQVNPAWLLQPDWQVDRQVAFLVPENATLTRLHIALPMGGSKPTVEWLL